MVVSASLDRGFLGAVVVEEDFPNPWSMIVAVIVTSLVLVRVLAEPSHMVHIWNCDIDLSICLLTEIFISFSRKSGFQLDCGMCDLEIKTSHCAWRELVFLGKMAIVLTSS